MERLNTSLSIEANKNPMQPRFVSDFYCFVLRGKENPLSGPLLLRYSFASNPFKRPFMEWEVNGTCNGLTWEVHRTYFGGEG